MVGELLRAEREKQNLTVKDIEAGTSIRALYIESIEKGEYGVLPGEVYTKGFIRNYAGYLKLDVETILKQYNEERHPEQVAQQEAMAAEAAAQKMAAAAPVSKPVEQPAAPAYNVQDDFHGRVEKSRHMQNLVIGVVAVAAVAGGAYFFLGGANDTAATQPPKQQTTQSSSANKPAPAAQPEKKKFDDVEVSAKFTDRCWTKVVVDGKTEFEGTAEKGKTMSWKGKEKVIVTAGNAGAVELTYNGNTIGKLGEAGEVIEKDFTKSNETNVK